VIWRPKLSWMLILAGLNWMPLLGKLTHPKTKPPDPALESGASRKSTDFR